MKHNSLILAAIAFVMSLAFAGCKKQEQEILTPKIIDDKVETTATSATFTWKVDWIGNRISVVEVSEHMDMSDSHFFGSEEELNKEVFTVLVEDLKPGIKYYYRYWVWNQNYLNNKFVMEEKLFTTATDLPSVKTLEVTDITRTSALGQGEILSDGGLEITERGVCWGTSHNPTTSGSHAASSQNTPAFSVLISDLTPEETYYVRAYAINANGTTYGDPEVWFITGDAVAPMVTTAQVTDISWRTATGGGEVTDDGGATVTERGVCWSTSHNPDVNDNCACNGTGMGSYTVNMEELTAETTYYVRAFAKNTADLVGYGEEVSFQTAQVPSYSISVSASPTSGGSVTGGGTYYHGQSCTLIATPANGYTFLCWTKGGVQVSTETNYTFDVTESGNYVASFTDQPLTFTINVSSNPSNGGAAYVGNIPGTTQGTFTNGQSCTVHATANSGYVFTNWTENGTVVSEEANYTFSVAGDRTLKANFTVSQNTYTINVSANPTNGGTVTGGGSFNQGQTCTVTATPETGFVFVKWTENGIKVSDDSSYTFTVSGNRTLVAQFQTLSYTVSTSSNPSNGGVTSGGGTYSQGQQCTVTATANAGYSFTNWTENGNVVSSDANYAFTINSDRSLVANFTLQTYTISVSANPGNGGGVSGGGTYTYGQSCTVVATAAAGFTFANWTENGNAVSLSASYTFTVTGNRIMVANFITIPTGAINGLFSIDANHTQVYFSQGNLQYIGSAGTPYWKFAEHQWDCLGDNGQGSTSQSVDRDLFGWGTSGYHNQYDNYNVNYQPWSTSTATVNTECNAYGYGPSTNMPDPNLTGTSAEYDWGIHNAISNGGNQAGLWRTMTKNEWVYVFNTRSASTVGGTVNARFVKATVNGIAGVVLFPDVYVHPSYLPSPLQVNTSGANFTVNNYSDEAWTTMENLGCVFLPVADFRNGTSVNTSSHGYYWSASAADSYEAYTLCFGSNSLTPDSYYTCYRRYGYSVRLVRPAVN